MLRGRLLGVLLALLSAASFGVMPVFTKVVYEGGAEPVGALSVRFAVAAVCLLALARLRGETFPAGRSLGTLLLLGGVGYTAQSLLYFSALERISAGLTALLLYFYPALVVVLVAVRRRALPRPVPLLCVVAATLGTALTLGPVDGGRVTGVVLGLGAAVVFACYVLVSSTVRDVGPFASAAVVMVACAGSMGLLAAVTRPAYPQTAAAWLALGGVALFGTVIALSAFFAALALLGPTDTAVVSTVEPVVSVGVAALVLGERLGPLQLLGGVVVLAAVAVLARTGTGRLQEEVPAPV